MEHDANKIDLLIQSLEKKAHDTDDSYRQYLQSAIKDLEAMKDNPDDPKAIALQEALIGIDDIVHDAVEAQRKFDAKHRDAVNILYGDGADRKRFWFVNTLTIRDCESILPDAMDRITKNGMPVRKVLGEILKKQPRTHGEKEAKFAEFLECLEIHEAVKLYEEMNPKGIFYAPSTEPANAIVRSFSALTAGKVPEGMTTTTMSDGKLCIEHCSKKSYTRIIVNDERITRLLHGENKKGTRGGADLEKLFIYILVKCHEQHNERCFIDIHDMVSDGLYGHYTNARRAVLDNIGTIKNCFSYQIRSAKWDSKGEHVLDTGGNSDILKTGDVVNQGSKEDALIYFYDLPNGAARLELKVNLEMLDTLFVYCAPVPKWIFSLPQNAFSLARYIFMQGRQNGEALRDKGFFHIRIEKIREQLGLKKPEECSNPATQIREPIEKAINEINAKAKEAKDRSVNILVVMDDGSDPQKARVKKWLYEGKIRVNMRGFCKESNIRMANDKQSFIEKKKK